jgi:hypothetical protein
MPDDKSDDKTRGSGFPRAWIGVFVDLRVRALFPHAIIDGSSMKKGGAVGHYERKTSNGAGFSRPTRKIGSGAESGALIERG